MFLEINFEFFLNNGIEPRTGELLGPRTGDLESFGSFDDLMMAFKKQLAHFMGLVAEWDIIWSRLWAELYPNPVEDLLSVEIEANETGSLEVSIINNLGQTILKHEKEVISGKFSFDLDLSFLPMGVYYLKVKKGSGRYWLEKVIKIY